MEGARDVTKKLIMRTAPLVALDALEELGDSGDAAVLLKRTSAILNKYGYSAFVLSRWPRRPSERRRQLLLNGWPSGWNERYEQANHFDVDPVAAFCELTSRPFAWSDVPPQLMNGDRGMRVVHEAADFGLSQALCIPLHTPLASGGMSIAGKGFVEDPGLRSLASLLAFRICSALDREGPTKSGGAYLSTRERDVLSWIAMGKTVDEIGTILAISAHTVGEHLKKIRAKLVASNNAHAIVKALQTAQIQL